MNNKKFKAELKLYAEEMIPMMIESELFIFNKLFYEI